MAVMPPTVRRRTLSEQPPQSPTFACSQSEPPTGIRRRAVSGLSSSRTALLESHRPQTKPEVSERGVQCDVDDPDFGGAPLSRKCLDEIAAGPSAREARLSLSTYFSRFDEARELGEWAAALAPSELASLAARFLGTHLCGMRLTLRGASRCGKYKRPIRFPERFVRDAALLAEQHPVFRDALENSAQQLLFGAGISRAECPDLGGENLLRLAARRPGQWGMLGCTAIGFADRLVGAGVLSRSIGDRLSAELVRIRRSLEAESSNSRRTSMVALALGLGDKMDEASERLSPMLMGLRALWLIICGAFFTVAWCGMVPSIAAAAGVAAALVAGMCLEMLLLPEDDSKRVASGLRRIFSEEGAASPKLSGLKSFVRDRYTRGSPRAPPSFVHVRHVGTTLHPQDDKVPGPQPYCLISVQPTAEVIPNAIQAQFIADYLRLVAGGDHKPGVLEARAKEAELDVTRQLRLRSTRGML